MATTITVIVFIALVGLVVGLNVFRLRDANEMYRRPPSDEDSD